jgi:hypothetical protein
MNNTSDEKDFDENLSDADLSVSSDTEVGPEPIDENTARTLEASLRAAAEGISRGISMDFASERDTSSVFNDIFEGILAPLTLSMPARALERGIKGTSMPYHANKEINSDAIRKLESIVISPALQLYESNFHRFIKALEKTPISESLKQLNDITNINIMAIEFKGRETSVSPLSPNSPIKIITEQIIPILREKFDAVASFRHSLEPGSFVTYAELERFYKAISEWRDILKAFRTSSDNIGDSPPKAKENKEEADILNDEEEEGQQEEEGETGIAEDIYIESVRPGQHVDLDPTGENRWLSIDDNALSSQDTPVIKLYINGEDADEVNSSGSGEEYLRAFIDKDRIYIPDEIELSNVIKNVTRESVSGGSEVTIFFKPDGIKALRGGSTERVEIMRISTSYGDIPIYVDDASQVEALNRVASTDSTPYYQAVSPYNNEAVFFTPADLVMSGGSVKDSKGNKFKPKKIKGKSLAQRVMSKGFGKVRKKK